MRSVYITIPNFVNRFPSATEYLKQNNVEIINKGPLQTLDETELTMVLDTCPVLFIATDKCDATFLENCTKTKLICKMGSGIENIDLDYCRKKGIAVSNSKGCNTNAVAEMTILLMLSSLRKLNKLSTIAKTGDWKNRFPGGEIKNKTVGLVGFGGIAQKIASLLQPFEVKIIAYDPYLNREKAKELNVEATTLETVVKESDIISLHIPGTADNYHLFDDSLFSKMKEGAIFINCARGSLVDEQALFNHLSNNHLSAAAIDVWEKEPLAPNNKLFLLDNFIGTPHSAGSTTDSAYSDSMTVAKSIVACFDGNEIPSRIV